MGRGFVQLALADGEMVSIYQDDVRRLYDALWALVPEPGAASAAAILHHEMLQPGFSRVPITMTSQQGHALQIAMSRVADVTAS